MPDLERTYADILADEIERGQEELERPLGGLLLSGLSAGLDVGFSVLLIGVVTTLLSDSSAAVTQLAMALVYPVGFIFVVAGQSELFTEHTTLAVLPAFARRASPVRVMRLWAAVYVSNVLGACLFGSAVAYVGPALGVIDPSELHQLAQKLIDHDWHVIVLSGVLAGWMMGLLSWLVTASRDTVGQLVFIALVTGGISLAGLHHSIVGAAELAAGWWSDPERLPSFEPSFVTLAASTLGNAIGGVFFVALLKFSHARLGSNYHMRNADERKRDGD